MPENPEPSLANELETLLNRHSRENASNTPDFILARFMRECLLSFEAAVRRRDEWMGLNSSASEADNDNRAQSGHG